MSMKPRHPNYEHRAEPEEPHPVAPTRDNGIPNPNRCAVCGIAIVRVSSLVGDTEGAKGGGNGD